MSAEWVILHGGALGDLVLTVQLALRLRPATKLHRLRIVSRSDLGDLSGCQPGIVRHAADGLGLHWLYADSGDPPPDTLLHLIRDARVLNALSDDHSAVHHRLTDLQRAELFSFDPRPRAGLTHHVTQQWQSDLAAQGLQFAPGPADLDVPPTLAEAGRDVLRGVGSDAGCIMIHPGSGGREKCWPLANYLRVARRLAERGAGVCLLLGPVEREWWDEAKLAGIRAEFPVLDSPEPDALTAALAAARVLLSNDSGPAHLAALLGTATATIFGPTAPEVWRPLGPAARVIVGNPGTGREDWGIRSSDVISLLGEGVG